MASYTRYNVVRAGDPYKNREGVEKTSWEPVGSLIRNEETGSISLKLNITGLWYSVFEVTDDRPVAVPDPAPTTPDPTPIKGRW